MLYKWEQKKPNQIYLSQPINGVWHHWTWKEFGQEVRKMAAFLKSLDLAKERLKILESCNCEEYTELKQIIDGTKKSKY